MNHLFTCLTQNSGAVLPQEPRVQLLCSPKSPTKSLKRQNTSVESGLFSHGTNTDTRVAYVTCLLSGNALRFKHSKYFLSGLPCVCLIVLIEGGGGGWGGRLGTWTDGHLQLSTSFALVSPSRIPRFCDRRNDRKIKQTPRYSETLAVFQNDHRSRCVIWPRIGPTGRHGETRRQIAAIAGFLKTGNVGGKSVESIFFSPYNSASHTAK